MRAETEEVARSTLVNIYQEELKTNQRDASLKPMEEIKQWLSENRKASSTVGSLRNRKSTTDVGLKSSQSSDESLSNSQQNSKVVLSRSKEKLSGGVTPKKRGRPKKPDQTPKLNNDHDNDDSDWEPLEAKKSKSTKEERSLNKNLDSNDSENDTNENVVSLTSSGRASRRKSCKKECVNLNLFKNFRVKCLLCTDPRPFFLNKDSLFNHINVSHIVMDSGN